MTSQADFVQPPRVAVWLVNLFAPVEEAESILGDLLEEFTQVASKSGVGFARSWYWRQSVRTVGHLAGTGFRTAPWTAAAAIVVGFLLMRFGLRLSHTAVEAVLDRYQVWENHFDAYRPWIGVTEGMQHVIVATLVGIIVAVAAKGREMSATMALGLFLSALGVSGAFIGVARTTGDGDYGFLWELPWMFASSIAAVVGGAIVRSAKSGATTRPSAT
jgi:hypothetical protein